MEYDGRLNVQSLGPRFEGNDAVDPEKRQLLNTIKGIDGK